MNADLKNELIQKKEYFFLFYSLVVFIPTINYYLSYFLKANDLPTTTIPFYFGLYIVVLYSYYSSVKKSLSPICCVFVVLFLYSITSIFWPQNMEFMFGDIFDACYNPLYRIVFLGLPLVFIPFVISDYYKLEKPFVYLSVLNNVAGVFVFWFVVVGKQLDFEYMTYAYNMLFSSCFLFAYSYTKKKKFLLALSFFSLSTLLFVGSRGATICVLFFFIVYSLFRRQMNFAKKWMFLFFLAVLSFSVYVFFVDIMLYLVDLMDYLGFNSRIIRYLLSSDFAKSSGRDLLFENLLERIADSPVYGYGIFGDRVLNQDFLRITGYAHNIFIELFVDFGVFVGSILSSAYLFFCFFFLTKSRENDFINCLFIAIFSSSFVKLLVTGSYLTEQNFYLLMGGFVIVCRFCCKSLKRDFPNECCSFNLKHSL